jgi:hypothetical protein
VPTYLLAYFKHNVDQFRDTKRPMTATLAYALVPADLEGFVGHMRFATISEHGRPLGEVLAHQGELLTLRQVDVPAGQKDDGVEGQLLGRLKERAWAAHHVLPALCASTRTPAWSKMAVPRDVLWTLRRRGGA